MARSFGITANLIRQASGIVPRDIGQSKVAMTQARWILRWGRSDVGRLELPVDRDQNTVLAIRKLAGLKGPLSCFARACNPSAVPIKNPQACAIKGQRLGIPFLCDVIVDAREIHRGR